MNPFETLGLPVRFQIERAELDRVVRELNREHHPDRVAQADSATRIASAGKSVEINDAYRALRDDISRAKAVLEARGFVAKQRDTGDPSFLMEMMELREALSGARVSKDYDRVDELAAEVRTRRSKAVAQLACLLDGDCPKLEQAAKVLGELRYYHRFLDEVIAIEDEADELGL